VDDKSKSDNKITLMVYTENNSKVLKESLESIRAVGYSNFDVVFIDNQSIDGTADIIKNFINTNPQIKSKLVVRRSRRTSSVAIDTDKRYAKGDIVFIVRSPIILRPDILPMINELFRTFSYNYVTVNTTFRSNFEFLELAGNNYTLFNSRYKKLLHFVSSNENLGRSEPAYVYRRLKDSQNMNSRVFYESRIAISRLTPLGWATKSSANFSSFITNITTENLLKAAVRVFTYLIQLSISGSIVLAAVLSILFGNVAFFIVCWAVYCVCCLLIIVFGESKSFRLKLNQAKHIGVFFQLHIVYFIYEKLQSASRIYQR
jgi:glycosyltransferase involved in cell wall biosynthesis